LDPRCAPGIDLDWQQECKIQWEYKEVINTLEKIHLVEAHQDKGPYCEDSQSNRHSLEKDVIVVLVDNVESWKKPNHNQKGEQGFVHCDDGKIKMVLPNRPELVRQTTDGAP